MDKGWHLCTIQCEKSKYLQIRFINNGQFPRCNIISDLPCSDLKSRHLLVYFAVVVVVVIPNLIMWAKNICSSFLFKFFVFKSAEIMNITNNTLNQACEARITNVKRELNLCIHKQKSSWNYVLFHSLICPNLFPLFV